MNNQGFVLNRLVTSKSITDRTLISSLVIGGINNRLVGAEVNKLTIRYIK